MNSYKLLLCPLIAFQLVAAQALKTREEEREEAAVKSVESLLQGNIPNKTFATWCEQTLSDLSESKIPEIQKLYATLDKVCFKTTQIDPNEASSIIGDLTNGVRVYNPKFGISYVGVIGLMRTIPAWMFPQQK